MAFYSSFPSSSFSLSPTWFIFITVQPDANLFCKMLNYASNSRINTLQFWLYFLCSIECAKKLYWTCELVYWSYKEAEKNSKTLMNLDKYIQDCQITCFILQADKFRKCDWLRPVVFSLPCSDKKKKNKTKGTGFRSF